jgi:hypothetical protein
MDENIFSNIVLFSGNPQLSDLIVRGLEMGVDADMSCPLSERVLVINEAIYSTLRHQKHHSQRYI